ncbi:MAG TPA: haloacid dehalogenase-like hydrolase [Bdellovibrionales bacterium]|nr:haloacid dehalogenase-like hydrolase [Bdellovibrionales bacterium]
MISKSLGPVNEFSPQLWNDIETAIARAKRETRGPLVAAFDADNTLWDSDAGETFFDWQIHNSGLDLPADPWAHYKELKKPDPRVGYVWLAQINKGIALSQVREWAKTCLQQKTPWPVYASQKKLVTRLKEEGFEVFIVTASIKWAVEPFGSLVGVDYDHVIGIETEVVDGIVTDKPVLPMTWREGKAEGLLARTGGVAPAFASGNTLGDSFLLAAATHFRLAVSTQPDSERGSGLWHEEEKLRTEALTKNWPLHRFR